ncbi:hypothetical protein KS4_30950 [Poriferisphaera corsica]|uniref:Uncharacterized protein n=1 Tax=Poriferisphaera corsica TaxID=2528020 RepID=A0A517YXR6_9BACT|nr:hypothetical protein [Poriferisphaera corsica]QDU35018.1 hypothetical protein KS4_30950 [Poriferisphaera corsica]
MSDMGNVERVRDVGHGDENKNCKNMGGNSRWYLNEYTLRSVFFFVLAEVFSVSWGVPGGRFQLVMLILVGFGVVSLGMGLRKGWRGERGGVDEIYVVEDVRRRTVWKYSWVCVVESGLAMFLMWFHPTLQSLGIFFGLMGGMYGVMAFYMAVREFPEHHYVWAWLDDRGRCGRCGYDVSRGGGDVCSECGWMLPRVDDDGEILGQRVERRDVWAWWKQGNWRIVYLEDVRRSAGMLVLMIVGYVGMGAMSFGLSGQERWSVIMGLVWMIVGVSCLHHVVNLWRIGVYMVWKLDGGDEVRYE